MKKEINPRLGKVGGQAVLEGVMMKSADNYAISVRREDGTIAHEKGKSESVRKKYKILGWPIIRGVAAFVESLVFSYKTLMQSTEMLGIEEGLEPESKFEKWLDEKFGDKLMNVVMIVGTVLGVALALCLFIYLPGLATKGIDKLCGGRLGLWKNLISGVIKILIFIGYMVAVSFMKDIRRTFEYHGAEHKTIFCYEAGEELTVENVKKHIRFHPRCGTSFIFVILLISILISTLANMLFSNLWDNSGIQFLSKIILLPLVTGIGFEFLMYAGKHDNLFTKICSAPGLWMQRITTKEPDDGMIECAIMSLKSCMPDEFPDFEYVDPHTKETEGPAEAETDEAAETVRSEEETASSGNTEENAEA